MSVETSNSIVICTLAERDYFYGVGALANSLFKAGFEGKFFCGYRGSLPKWVKGSVAKNDSHVLSVGGKFEITFVKIETHEHFNNYKPQFMLDLFKGRAADAQKIYYFDTDIVVKCRWPTMDAWAQDGLALCEDLQGYMPDRHPIRLQWKKWLGSFSDIKVVRSLDHYYNGGFIGVPREHREFLSLWQKLMQKVAETKGQNGKLEFRKAGNREDIFKWPDQDALNMALMCSDFPINPSGPEGMDFAPHGFLLSHSIGAQKPWKGGFFTRALKGYRPTKAQREFFKYTGAPIKVLSWAQKSWLKTSLRIASKFNYFYCRD